MNITARLVTPVDLYRRACEMTLQPGKDSRISLQLLLRAEHSPIRTVVYWVQMFGIPSFVSVHLVRHHIGIEHFVQSMRDDRGGAGDDVVTRLTPVNHAMLINAQALINVSRKRLCSKAHRETQMVVRALRGAIRQTELPEVADFMVPECEYRGECPEPNGCGHV